MNWLRRPSAQAWISLRTCSHVISRARFMARCCSNSPGTRGSSAAVLLSSSRAVVVTPLDVVLSYRWTSSSHFSSPAGRSCNLHRSGTKICRDGALRFPPLRGSQRRTNRLNASRLDGAGPGTTLKLVLSVNARSATREPVRSFLDHLQLVLHLPDQTVNQVLRS